ncbi:hypothetical protein RND81_12G212200 [Saponaria officinalis]|uniref:Protein DETOXIFICATION n=1 Tax=Saponaria officinalis TaxID=3572 RepID=A0AAW1HDE6_SAPOF
MGGERWWTKVVDTVEAKKQIKYAMPMVMTNVTFYLIPVVSVMFVGHLGELQLAASTLANSWANVTGYAIMSGLSIALETLCGQAFGAKHYKLLGIYLQTSCLISFIFSILISILWWFTKPILIILLRQNPEVSNEAVVYIRYLIPGIFAFGMLQNIMRFLQTQSVVWPLVFCSLVPLLLQIGIVAIVFHCTTLGFRGAALAVSITFWISLALLLVYVRYSGTLKRSWNGFTKEIFRFVVTNLKLALTSTTMLCLEYWAFEAVIILAGLMPNSKASTSLVAMCLFTVGISYNLMYGLSAAASTRVSNELGAMRPDRAKNAMCVAMKLAAMLMAVIVLSIGFGREKWAHLFSDDADIIKLFASMTPLLCTSIAFDSIQCILSETNTSAQNKNFRPQRRNPSGYLFNSQCVYFGMAIPVGCLLAFKLHLHAKGLWIGLICGIGFQSGAIFVATCLKKWVAFEQPSHGSNHLRATSA